METFSALLAICETNSPHNGQRRGALIFSLSCTWTNGCANNLDAGDLRRHRAHYDVTAMELMACPILAIYQSHKSHCTPVKYPMHHNVVCWGIWTGVLVWFAWLVNLRYAVFWGCSIDWKVTTTDAQEIHIYESVTGSPCFFYSAA